MADLEALISSSVADARESGDLPEAEVEIGDESTDEGLETPVEEAVEAQEPVAGEEAPVTPPVEEKAVEAAVAPKVEDPLKAELGPEKDKKGRENRIPYSQVKRIIANQVKKATTPFEAQVKELETVRGTYEERLNKIDGVEQIMFKEPARFLSMLQTIPGYKDLLDGKLAVVAPAVDPNSEMPKPDADMGGGKFTYSPEGLQKLLDWKAAQTQKAVLEELKPLREQFDGEQRVAALRPHIDAQIEEAATNWEGFVDNHMDILKALTDDRVSQAKVGQPPKLTLERAYLQVMVPKFKALIEAGKADKAKIRAEVLAELKKAPQSTGVTPSKGKVVDTGEPKSIESIIKAAIAPLKR